MQKSEVTIMIRDCNGRPDPVWTSMQPEASKHASA